MLDVILQILSVIGIVLLVLLILLVVLLALVLFFPITYGFWGAKQEEVILKAKANWLFGLVRVRYAYPEPGRLTVKVLWFTLYDALLPGGGKTTENTSDESVSDASSRKEKNETHKSEATKKNVAEAQAQPEQGTVSDDTTIATKETDSTEGQVQPTEEVTLEPTTKTNSLLEKILKKIEQIKYTILGLCDKIKEIWENINYYVALLKEDDTKALFQHVILRVGNILKSIRPRHLKADILFGTGSPDTTGYAYAVYGMLSAFLGPKFIVTPDFEQSILKGELQFSGHITIWILLINGLKLLFDQKLHGFIKKVKAGIPQKEPDKKPSERNQE